MARRSRCRCSSGPRFLGVPVALGVLLSILLTSTASAAFVAPSFIRQWQAGSGSGGGGIATDPFGNVFVITGAGGANNKVTKYAHDGTLGPGQWPQTISGTSGIATDPVGHVYVDVGPQLLEYTNGGGFLGAFMPPGLEIGPLAFDLAGNLYSNGTNASGQRSVNEYHYNGTKWKRINSALYPGAPNFGFFPAGF